MENSGKQNPKMGFKSPPEHIVRVQVASKWLIRKHLRYEDFYVKHVIQYNCFHFSDPPATVGTPGFAVNDHPASILRI